MEKMGMPSGIPIYISPKIGYIILVMILEDRERCGARRAYEEV